MGFSKTGSQEPAIPGPPVLVHAPLSALAPTDTNTPLEEKKNSKWYVHFKPNLAE